MKREYGIDLLKIIAMMLIVCDHILYWGGWGFCAGRTGVKGYILESVDAVCLCHVNCFVLASGWIMSRLEFKFKRIVKLWMEVFGYSLAFTLLTCFCFPSIPFGMKDVIKSLLPVSMDCYWFFTQYTILFFTMPLLNSAIKNLDRKTLLALLGVGFVCFSVHPFVFKTDIFHLNRGYSALWFMYLYLLAGTMAVRGMFAGVTMRMIIVVAVFAVIGGVVGLHLRMSLLLGIEHGFNAELFRSYNCPFVLCYSIAMLLLFSKMNNFVNSIKTPIGMIIPSVFAVYIIHSNKWFRKMTDWNEFMSGFLDNNPTVVCVSVVVLSPVLIFVGCIVIDVVWKCTVSKFSMVLRHACGGR